MSLMELNKMFDENSKINALLYFWSSQSKNCAIIKNQVPLVVFSYFNTICVDDINIKKTLLSSNKFKIKNVPSIILISITNEIILYEGLNSCMEIFKFIFDTHKALNEEKLQLNNEIPQANTPISTLFNESEKENQETDLEKDNTGKKVKMGNLINSRMNTVDSIPEREPDFGNRPDITEKLEKKEQDKEEENLANFLKSIPGTEVLETVKEDPLKTIFGNDPQPKKGVKQHVDINSVMRQMEKERDDDTSGHLEKKKQVMELQRQQQLIFEEQGGAKRPEILLQNN
jgi:hypothetical protein